MERVTVEYNGERLTLEVPDGTPDSQIQDFLKQQQSGTGPVGVASMEPPSPAGIAAQGAGSAALTAYGMSGPAITPRVAYDVFGKPVIEAAGSTYQKYVSDPFRSGRGLPLPSLDVARQAGPDIMTKARGVLSTAPEVGGGTAPEYLKIRDYVREIGRPEVYDRMREAFSKGGAQGVKDLLESDRSITKLMKDPRFAELAGEFTGKVPSGMSQLGRGLGMLGRTAARVAGPVGLGMTAYDIYQAAPTVAKMFQTGVAGRGGALGQTADEFGMPAPVAPVEPNYIDEIRRKAAQKALGQ